MLLEGSELTKEDRESQLYDDFEHFRQHKGESIHDYYVRGQGMNLRGGSAAGYEGAQNRVGNVNQGQVRPGQARTVKCYNCNGTGHITRNCTQPKRPQNSEYYKDKMLLMQAQENGVALDAERNLILRTNENCKGVGELDSNSDVYRETKLRTDLELIINMLAIPPTIYTIKRELFSFLHKGILFDEESKGYPKETMGYSFYYPPENKVLVARNAEYLENILIDQEASGSRITLRFSMAFGARCGRHLRSLAKMQRSRTAYRLPLPVTPKCRYLKPCPNIS
nr:serine-threonine/tyrosine-protein kinase catalytic domain-containing protein [Tanacetum cinerariifolium]